MVTVVIPLYNREDTIGRALLSVINQTYQDIEIIIVDDCSDDKSVEIVESFNDSRLHIIKLNSNEGASSARNIGIKAAKGELIAFQDSDDEWYPEKLSIQIQALLDTNSDIVASKYQQINQNGKKRIIPIEDIADMNIPNRILMGNFIGTPTLLCKKSCFTENLFDSRLPRLQDWDLLIALSRKYNIHFINEVLVDAYLQNNSISIDNNKLEKALAMIFAKYDEYFANNVFAHKKILRSLGYVKMQNRNFAVNYYKKAMRVGGADIRTLIRLLQFWLKKAFFYVIGIANR